MYLFYFKLYYILYCINSISSYIKATYVLKQSALGNIYPVKTYINHCHCICTFQTLTTQNTFYKLECVLLCTHTHTHTHTLIIH